MRRLLLVLLCGFIIVFSGCNINDPPKDSADGYIIKVSNFPVTDGLYAIPGDHNGWNNSDVDVDTNAAVTIDIVDGSGESDSFDIAVESMNFVIVDVDTWDRPWFPAVDGNLVDAFSGLANTFQVSELVAGGAGTITIDGSTSPVTMTTENE